MLRNYQEIFNQKKCPTLKLQQLSIDVLPDTVIGFLAALCFVTFWACKSVFSLEPVSPSLFLVMCFIVQAFIPASCKTEGTNHTDLKQVGKLYWYCRDSFLLEGELGRRIPAGWGGELQGVPAGHGHPRDHGQAFGGINVSCELIYII